jgi:predicted NAD-dependent protein-ADP-ribosyltransferase YbiA (DUF1768 family)
MAQKAKLFGDTAIYHEILNTTTPKEAKHLGRKVQGLMRQHGMRIELRLWLQEIWQNFRNMRHCPNFCS